MTFTHAFEPLNAFVAGFLESFASLAFPFPPPRWAAQQNRKIDE